MPSIVADGTEEILDALETGEFDFDALKWREDTRGRSVAMSLAKNTQTFHRLPSGTFGLQSWYPGVAQAKPRGVRGQNAPNPDTGSAAPVFADEDSEEEGEG
jgi:hypothetical protein